MRVHVTLFSGEIASSQPTLDVDSITAKTEEALDGKRNDHPASLEYLSRADGTVALTHVIQIQNEDTGTWYEAFVDAHSGELLSVTDFVAEATVSYVGVVFGHESELMLDYSLSQV